MTVDLTPANTSPNTSLPGGIPDVDVTDAAFKADPFPFYARLRAEAPVYSVRLTRPFQRRAWLVTRYEDVRNVLKDERFAKDRRRAMSPAQLKQTSGIPPMLRVLERNLLGLDKPDHTRLRALVQKAFTPGRIEQMREQTEALANELLDVAAQKGEIDLLAEFAQPLPLTLIGRILGVPAEDNAKFRRWTQAFVSVGRNTHPLFLVPSLLGFLGYFKKLIRERSARPQDDLVTALVQASDDGAQMREDEVLAMIFLLLSAGHETTVNLIGNGVLALLEHPAQWEKLCADPTLGKTAVEELLRFVCPVEMATERYAREDLTIAGTAIARGELVLAVIGSANRDADYFDDPDTLDIARENNRHLAFGQGAHYCLGASLSRLEGQIALTVLAQRMPHLHLRVPPEQLRWRGGFLLRGLEALPVSF